MSRRRPPRAWIGAPRPVDPAELLGPRGLTQELLEEPEEPEAADANWFATQTIVKGNQSLPGHADPSRPTPQARTPDAPSSPSALDAFHKSLLSEQRLARIESVIAARLSSVTVVLDRLIDPHNTAAILRSAEGMGIGALHIVPHEEGDASAHRRVTRDADKWLALTQARSGAAAARALTAQGFNVYAGHLDGEALLVQDLPVDRPLALLFGNEHEGPSPETLAACSGTFRIPMAGFTQSFNVSVAAAIALFGVVWRRRAHLGAPGDLDEQARQALRSRYWRLAAKLARRIRRPPGSTTSGA